MTCQNLDFSKGSTRISPRKETKDAVRERIPDVDRILREAGIASSCDALTNAELRYIASMSPDTFRDRVSKGRQKGGVEEVKGDLREDEVARVDGESKNKDSVSGNETGGGEETHSEKAAGEKPQPKTYGGIPRKKVAEYTRLMEKKHPELDADLILTELSKIRDGKLMADAFAWVMKGAVRLPEDMYKVERARELAEKAGCDAPAEKRDGSKVRKNGRDAPRRVRNA
ncbi:MAG: hypothetical protein IJR99_01525 [Kiritimatiellae bacterium]|nr:hypothetical protein [Kiritimatiellia bacterium]